MKRNNLYLISVVILALVVVGFVGGPLVGAFQGLNRNAITFGRFQNKNITYQPGNYFDEQLQEISLFLPSTNSGAR